MITEAIRFLLSNYFFVFLVLGALCAVVSIARKPPATRATVLEAFLSYFCLVTIGIFFLYNFVMHVFFQNLAASFIGWQNSPFQLEVGFASLGFGMIGVLAFRPDYGLRLAAVVGTAGFAWGAAGGHIYQMIKNGNFAPGNAGLMLWMDIFVPAIGFVLLALWRRSHSQPASTHLAL